MTRPLFGRVPVEKPRPIVVLNFDKYNPPAKAVNDAIRKGGPLTWLRWETIGHRDPDLLDMPPAQRWLWIVLLDFAGKQHRIDGLRVIHMTEAQLAREADMSLEDVKNALIHLYKCKRIRYGRKSAKRITEQTPPAAGGDSPPEDHPTGGHVRTDAQTDKQTSRARDEQTTTSEDDEPYADTPEGAKLRADAQYKTALHRRVTQRMPDATPSERDRRLTA